MKICWFGIYDIDYPRNYILLNGLEECGVQVVHCGVGARERWRYFKLIYKLLTFKEEYDVIYAAFPAQSVVMIAKLFSRKKVVMDGFYSMFDSIVNDRELHSWYHLKSLWMGFLDWTSVMSADHVIADTDEHAQYWASWWGINKKKFSTVLIGSDTKYFFPTNDTLPEGSKFMVQYHGSYIPLQGLDIIIEAIGLLKDEAIQFRFIGSGQEFEKTKQHAENLGIKTIEYIERIPFSEVNKYLNEADVIFGIFGDTVKADRVIPNKLYEGLAVRKPVITKDNEVVRRVLEDDEIVFVERDAEQLKEAILMLKNDDVLCKKYAEAGYKKFQESFSQKPIARSLLTSLETVVK